MPEKWHKINKFEKYQKMIVRNSPAFHRRGFVASQKLLTLFFLFLFLFLFFLELMSMISTQVRWQDPWSLCKLWERRLDWFHLREYYMGSSPPSPPPWCEHCVFSKKQGWYESIYYGINSKKAPDPHNQKVNIEVRNFLKFGVNRAYVKRDTAIQKLQNLTRIILTSGRCIRQSIQLL